MFAPQPKVTGAGSALSLLELIFHSTVRAVRKSHRNPIIGLLINMLQAILFVSVFFVMFAVLNLRSSAVRGDFLLYMISGIFLFMTHTKALGAVVGAEGPASPMMLHARMNTIVSIASAALSSLYIQVLSVIVILTLYYTMWQPFVIERPVAAFSMLLLSWFSGVAVGLVFLAIKPWFPGFVGIAATVYARANMIASGKMVLANTLPPKMLAMFWWNPLFHTIDQSRGFVFINYNPHNSSLMYPIYFSLAFIMIGLMGEFYSRSHASASWGAAR